MCIGRDFMSTPILETERLILKHFHVHDGLGKKNHLTLGTGEIDLSQRLAVAKNCNARCVVETKTIEALKRSADYLKSNSYI